MPPTVLRPREPPCPRKSNATTPPARASTRAIPRDTVPDDDPVKPCATTNASSRELPGAAMCRASTGTPSAASSTRSPGPRRPAVITVSSPGLRVDFCSLASRNGAACDRRNTIGRACGRQAMGPAPALPAEDDVAQLLLLTNALAPSAEVLPALGLLPHQVRVLPAEAAVLVDAPPADAVIVDGRRDLAGARSLCRLLRTTGLSSPLLLVLTEGGMAAVAADWGADDVVLDSAGPAEVEARLRLATGRNRLAEAAAEPPSSEIRAGDVLVDEVTYTAKVRGRLLDLTYKEFELLKFLAQHPGRVFTRAQLLQEVWGYDYFGGTRTVDVHVRRLRAKLGPEREALIGTVRNVGYKFVAQTVTPLPADDAVLSVTKVGE